jgi:Protein of unknown function DUF262
MPPATRTQLATIGLTELVNRALRGGIRVPSFQRPFQWPSEAVLDLLGSVVDGYPIGNLVVWREPAPAGAVAIGPLRLDAPETDDAWWVVDGLQRVASLVGVLAAPADTPDARFRIFLNLRTNTLVSAGRRSSVPPHWLPLRLALSLEDLAVWESSRSLSPGEVALAHGVHTALAEYKMPVQVIEKGAGRVVSDIFTRLNTHAVQLSEADIANARLQTAGEGLSADLRAFVRTLGYGEFDQRLLASLLALGPQDARPGDALRELTQAVAIAVDLLRNDAGFPHHRLLPRPSWVLPSLVNFALQFGAPDPHTTDLLSRWAWRVATGERLERRPAEFPPEVHAAAGAQYLLDSLGPAARPRQLDLGATDLDDDSCKVNTLALLSARPRALVPSNSTAQAGPVDVVGMLEAGQAVLAVIVPGPGPGLRTLSGTFANRLLHPPAPRGAILAALRAQPSPAVLASHLLDGQDEKLLRSKQTVKFLSRRRARLRTAISLFVEQRARWSFRDRPVGPLFDDEELADVG